MLQFARFLMRHAGYRGVIAVAVQLLGSLMEGVSILLLVPVLALVDRSQSGTLTLTIPSESWFGPLGGMEVSFLAVLIFLVVMVVAQAGVNMFRAHYVSDVMLGIINDIRLSVLHSMVNAKWRFYASHHRADLNHALTGDVDRIQTAAAALVSLIQMMTMVTVYVGLSLVVSPLMTLFALTIGLGMFVLLRPVRRAALRHGTDLNQNRQQQFRMVTDFLEGMKIAKSFNREGLFVDRIASLLERNKQFTLRYNRLAARAYAVYQILSAAALVIFVYIALILSDLSLPKLVVLLLLFMRVAPRFLGLQSLFQQLLQNVPTFLSMQAMKARFDEEQDVSGNTGQSPPPPFEHHIQLKQVSLVQQTLEGDKVLLDAVDARIEKGRVTALIGPSGAGKSTLADMLLGLVHPTSGQVRIDGTPLEASMMRGWREQIAFVPQDDFLMPDTIEANLRLAKLDASDADLWEALAKAQADEFVAALPDKLEEVIGDKGRRLSGGERQRISLARALLRKPQLLILDEATSALDWENQSRIADAIATLGRSMTVLTIAHRPSMIAFADNVIAMENGAIVEQGQFAALSQDPNSRLARMLAGETSSQ